MQSLKVYLVLQVNGEMLVRARGQLENAAQRVQVMYKGQGGSDRDVLPLAVQVVSNLLQVATRGKLLQEGDLATRQRVSARAIEILRDLLGVSFVFSLCARGLLVRACVECMLMYHMLLQPTRMSTPQN